MPLTAKTSSPFSGKGKMENGVSLKAVLVLVGFAAVNVLVVCWYVVEKSKYENPWVKEQSEVTGIRP